MARSAIQVLPAPVGGGDQTIRLGHRPQGLGLERIRHEGGRFRHPDLRKEALEAAVGPRLERQLGAAPVLAPAGGGPFDGKSAGRHQSRSIIDRTTSRARLSTSKGEAPVRSASIRASS